MHPTLKRTMIKLALPLVLLAATLLQLDEPAPARISGHDRAFDFWLGTWALTWNDTVKGTNVVTRELNGHVIAEHFTDPAGHYSGCSWSVYDSTADRWQQTWVDTQGAYLTFTGGLDGDRLVLRTAADPTGQHYKRMVFHSITADAFEWEWMATTDGGTSWQVQWHIHYQRQR